MEVVGTVLSVTQTLLSSLQIPEIKEAASIFGYKFELEKLQRTVSIIQAGFQDAERKKTLSELSAVEQLLIEDLKAAVYKADDLLDEFVTLSEQKQLIKDDGSIAKKISLFFSGTNPVLVAYKMSKGVKKIRKDLNAVVANKQFGFNLNSEPVKIKRPETSSFVNDGEIIGREKDLEKVVSMFLDPSVEQDVYFLSIVGIGGMGKTAFAQLVFNDSRVTREFGLRLWACVSDENQKQLDVKEVLGKILASVKSDEGTTLGEKQSKLQEVLFGKRYLLVLDDVWTKNGEEWTALVRNFVGGQRGSCIVVTTRSEETASIIKHGEMYKLQGLSKVDSWKLFERIAFGSNESNQHDEDLVKLGQEIVEGCAQVPLAIRVMGNFLSSQDKSKWQLFKENGLTDIMKSGDPIMSILQLSFHHLEFPLKSCFNYCALFPKDFRMEKEMLISLWNAQGYIIPLYAGQSIENAGEDYFSILLKRCFFQDIGRNECGEIVSCKMHDLVHDVARSVSRKEIFVANNEITNFNKKVLHCSIPIEKCRKSSLEKTHVRSYICISDNIWNQKSMENSFVMQVISSCRYLRVLSLASTGMRNLPNSLSTLSHLRYLDLSYNRDLEQLPKSISKLYNLQTLKLKICNKLQRLPNDLCKLIKLRVLDITFCDELKYMPRGMEKLTCLNRLSDFKVGREGYFENWKEWFNGLEELKALNGPKGFLRLDIHWPKNIKNVNAGEYIEIGDVLRSKHHLNNIFIRFDQSWYGERINDEVGMIGLMKDLHPPPHLKILQIWNYAGTRMADWASLLPNLVKLEIGGCSKIKEWGRRRIVSNNPMHSEQLPCLPLLNYLLITNCPELTWIPMCPKLELLKLFGFNERLVIGEVGHTSSSTSSQEVADWGVPKFKLIVTNNVAWLNSLPGEAFHCLEMLRIGGDREVEKLGEVGDVFRNLSSSLRTLEFYRCNKLKSVEGGGLEYLTALEKLLLYDCENLKLEEENVHEDGGIMPCPSLRSLQLSELPNLEYLPNWMQYLTALQTLEIHECQNLKAMPNWMPKLISLRNFYLTGCSESLERRCQEDPQGEDWPLIQHIPSIIFKKKS